MSFQIAQIPEESKPINQTFNIQAKPQPQISGIYTVKCCENTWNIERNILLAPHPSLPKCGNCGKKVVYIKTCSGSFSKDTKTVQCRRNFFQPNGAHNPYCPKCRPTHTQRQTKSTETNTSTPQ